MAVDGAYDALDVRIVNALIDNGRASLRSVADRLGVATSTVSTRLTRLEADGAIRGYVPQVDYAAFGYPVIAVVHFRTAGGIELPDALHSDRWTDIHRITGAEDLIAIGRLRTVDRVAEELAALRADPAIRSVRPNLVVDPVRQDAMGALEPN
jgi:DNA-binding Lrp family transcriptional regulator